MVMQSDWELRGLEPLASFDPAGLPDCNKKISKPQCEDLKDIKMKLDFIEMKLFIII